MKVLFSLVLLFVFIASNSFAKKIEGKKVLFVLTGATKLKIKEGFYETGYWLEEFSTLEK